MKIRNLFYMLLALPLVFAACEPEPAPQPEPEKEYAAELTLTSEATLEFPAEGGEGVITYTAKMVEVTRESPVPQPEVEATCEADWVTDLVVAENITFKVVANEAEARETKVVVTYGDKSFEVAVKQAAKQNEEPEPEDGVKFEASYLQGYYYGDQYSPGVGNYYVYLSDLGLDEEGSAYAGGTYYRLDLYGPLFEGDGEVSLPVGTYNFDANDTMVEWTIGNYYSAYIVFDENGYCTTGETGAPYTAATLVVTESGLTFTATINGEEHTVSYEGKGEFVDYTAEAGPAEFTANYAYAVYYGDQYSEGTADNFFFFLSDLGLDEEGYEVANGQYFRFDLYSELVDTTNGITLPDGTYTLDVNDSCAPGTFGYYYSLYYAVDEYGYDYSAAYYITSGTLTKAGNKITAEVTAGGNTYNIEYEGDITIFDGRDTEEEPVDPDPEDPDQPTPGESYSTLTGDVELNITNASYALEYYGDYFSADTDNWMLYIYEDTVTMDGAFIMLDFLCDPYADNIAGTYVADNGDSTYEQYTYFPGYVDGDDMYGVWYTEMVEGVDVTAMAPITDGEIKIEYVDGGYTITFDCVDDAGHKITGTVVANPIDYSASALSAQPAKRTSHKVVAMDKNKIEATNTTATKSTTLRVR
ncbi:MAG: hypothetical protein E7135_02425 [Rikenellaceae bacterium]|nr:hypothetical protein [Rikenellaceae bacterium]